MMILRFGFQFHKLNGELMNINLIKLFFIIILLILFEGCSSDSRAPLSEDELWPFTPSNSYVKEPISFTDQNYDFPQDGMGILKLLKEFPIPRDNAYIKIDYERAYPSKDCDETRSGIQVPVNDPDLPFEFEGVVTLHSRYYIKIKVCGEEERYYGCYFVQDKDAGIFVINDSRVADVTFGDRVKLRANALIDYYDIDAILLFELLEIKERNVPIYYEEIKRNFTTSDLGKVKRITGVVLQEPTSENFNEAIITDGTNNWLVSIDRELANRNVKLKNGMKVTLTGPVISNFGVKMVILSLGQIIFE